MESLSPIYEVKLMLPHTYITIIAEEQYNGLFQSSYKVFSRLHVAENTTSPKWKVAIAYAFAECIKGLREEHADDAKRLEIFAKEWVKENGVEGSFNFQMISK